MKRRGLILLLLISAHLLVCDLQPDGFIRHFRYVGLLRNWTEAQSYCREKFTDLATIQNSANSTEARRATGSSQFWIGLHRGPWKWSVDSTSSSFSSWGADEPQSGLCAAINKDGRWFSKDCTASYPFICYTYFGTYILIQYKKTWDGADSYCRTWQRNLATIRSQTDNDRVSNAFGLLSTPEVAWIGLNRVSSVWSDASSASYRQWNSLQPDAETDCVMMNSSSVTWFWNPCDEKRSFLCYVDAPPPKSMIRVVKVRLSAGSADLTDPAVQDSILQQLRQRMVDQGIEEEVKLRWKTQPDGKIFHREDERAPPAVCEEEDACV